MVMRTLKIIELEIPVKKSKIKKVVDILKKEFGNRVKIKVENGKIKISGEQISNYKVHDRILELSEGA